MATAEEILAKMTAVAETEPECLIDAKSRTISVPAEFTLLGVESDERAERIKFRCPRMVGDNLDLTKFGIRINYRNASGEKDGYPVDDVEADGDDIIFSWKLDRKVTKYKGDVTFIVCAVKGTENEWNTTLATAKVLEGLEAEIQGDEEDETLLEQLVAVTNQKLTEMNFAISDAKAQTEKTLQATKNAEIATKNAEDAAQTVFDQQYILTSETTFTGETSVTPTGQGAAIIKELQGGTKQAKTSGDNLFDASKLPTTSQDGATVTNNGDGSFTISGSANITKSNVIGHIYTAKEALSMLRVGDLKAKFEMPTNPYLKFGIYKNDGTGIQGVLNDLRTESTITVSEANIAKIESGEYDLRLYVVFTKDTPIKPGTIKPMIYQDGDGTWEPYTGVAPSPNPEYPQTIKSIGGNGWFDGEWMVGSYDTTTGMYVSNNNFACNRDMIECKEGDSITINMEVEPKNTGIIFYDKDKNFLTSSVSFINQKAPSGSKYFNFRHQKDGNSIESLGQTIVTINGKYAVKVKTHGKNLISGMEVGAYSHGNGNKIDSGNYRRSVNIIPVKEGKTYIVSQKEPSFQVSFVKYDENRRFMDFKATESMTIPKGCKYIAINIMIDLSEAHDVQLEESETPTSYEPYRSSISYIPLDSPLYEGDKIYLEDGELWEYRENERTVFDGSEDEGWTRQVANQGRPDNYYIDMPNLKKDQRYVGKMFCNAYLTRDSHASTIEGICGYVDAAEAYPHENWIYVIKNGFSNVTEFKTWLQSNPLEVVYKLATPTRKKLGSAEAFNLRTFNERTYIEVCGSEELGTENAFIVPRNQSGGIMTDAFCTAKRNEIQAAEQANLASRIAALEALAVKER